MSATFWGLGAYDDDRILPGYPWERMRGYMAKPMQIPTPAEPAEDEGESDEC